MPENQLPARKKVLFATVSILGGALLGFAVLEGGLSAVLFVRDLLNYIRDHGQSPGSQYDVELGWVSKPNVYLANEFGPGVYVRTNAQGFRNNRDLPAPRQPDRVRVMCSGDSFTYGVGVDNDHTWCNLLEQKNSRLETVNMGEFGYGVDQAYLHYVRDAAHIEHDIHLFAFITDDFRRMRSVGDWPYRKPVLALEHGALILRNVPVPRPSHPVWLSALQAAAQELRAFEFLRRMRTRFVREPPANMAGLDSLTWQTTAKIAENLAAIARSHRSILVWVLLPTRTDYMNDYATGWQRRLRAAAGTQFLYLDLIQQMKQLPPDSINALFLPPSPQYSAVRDVGGHYTDRGNAWVADRVYRFLETLPDVSRRLSPP